MSLDENLAKETKKELKYKSSESNKKRAKQIVKEAKKEYWKEVRHLAWTKTEDYLPYAALASIVLVPIARSVVVLPFALTTYVGFQTFSAWWSVPKPPSLKDLQSN